MRTKKSDKLKIIKRHLKYLGHNDERNLGEFKMHGAYLKKER